MHSKKQSRLRRAAKVRERIRRQGVVRLSVHRTSRHFYAQLIDGSGGRVLAAVGTLDKSARQQIKYGGNVQAAGELGTLLAARAAEVGVTKVAFDRSGFRYHGRVKAFAEAARAAGLQF